MTTPPETEVAVVGAGVVGLACAAALARSGREVLVLERREAAAREVTSRSSEVIHAGLYYTPGSLKARLCVRGRELLYARCRARGIPHRRLGKLVVARDAAEAQALETLEANARRNGVTDLTFLDAGQVAACEPALRAHAALLSPQTGIVDAHALADDLLAEAQAAGARLVTRVEVVGLEARGDRFRVEVRDADGEGALLEARALVNAAGLRADRVAELLGIDVEARGWRVRPCKGDYFALAPGAPLALQRLVYPLPARDGALGVHATLDLAGRLRFGPDAEYVDAPRYDVDPAKAEPFAAAVQRYLPSLRPEWLTPDYAGVRPRLTAPGEPARDFVVESSPPGALHLVGIESPGLTAALALAEEGVARLASL